MNFRKWKFKEQVSRRLYRNPRNKWTHYGQPDYSSKFSVAPRFQSVPSFAAAKDTSEHRQNLLFGDFMSR
jgi:hypothetical protein